MNPSEWYSLVEADLKSELANGPRIFRAMDPLHALEILAASPANYFLVLLDKGDVPEEHGPIEWIKARLGVYVAQNRGLSIDPAEVEEELTQRCETVRDTVLSKEYPEATTAVYTEYEGRDTVVTPEGFPLAAYELNFSLRLAGSSLTYRS